jgi:hypothetical protein
LLFGGTLGEGWTRAAAAANDIAAAIGIMLGGAWAYMRYVQRSDGETRADLKHDVTVIDFNGQRVIRMVLEIVNVGPVIITPKSGFTIVQIPPEKFVTGSSDPHKGWNELHRFTYPFQDDELGIEPSARERYYRDIVVPKETRCIQLHSSVSDDDSSQWDETTLHELSISPGA